MTAGRPLRVLVVRADGVGDTILTMPLLAALRLQPAPVEISMLASTAAAALARRMPNVDRILTIDRAGPLRQRLSLACALAREPFDVAICVSEKWWPLVWARASRARIRIGVDPAAVQPIKRVLLPVFLTHRVAVPVDPDAASPLHEVERYLALLAPLGVAPIAAPLSLTLPDAVCEHGRRRVRDLLGPGVRTVALQLSHKWSTEGWPATTTAGVCAAILDRLPDAGIVLLGGSREAGLGSTLLQRLGRRAEGRVADTGTTVFDDWAGLIHASRALVTMDTAAAHLAAAVGVPVVDVFCDHRFEHFSTRWAPWKVPSRALRRPAVRKVPAARRPAIEAGFHEAIAAALGELL